MIDETSGDSGFHNPADKTEYSWPEQGGATLYEVARSGLSDLSGHCLLFATSDTFWYDEDLPATGSAYH